MTEITETIRAEDMSEKERLDLAQSFVGEINEHLSVKTSALSDERTVDPQTLTEAYTGDTPAEALGKAYALRDLIETHSERSVTCELTGTEYLLSMGSMYEVEVIIE